MVAIAGIFWSGKYSDPEVESYEFAKVYKNSSTELKTIVRGDVPVKLLFADSVLSPFSFEATLRPSPRKGVRTLWLYCGQADNHGQIAVQFAERTIGVADNRLTERTKAPIPKLSRVGDLAISSGEVLLKFTGSSSLPRHYSELGLIVLSPPGMSQETLLSILTGAGGAPAFDLGIFVLVLVAAFGALIVLDREIVKDQPRPRGNIILTATILITLAGFVYCLCPTITAPPLAPAYASVRTGLEQGIDHGFSSAITGIKTFQAGILPKRQQTDHVPERLQASTGAFQTKIYRSNQEAGYARVSEKIFSGKLLGIQLMTERQFASNIALMAAAIGLLLVIDRTISSRWSAVLALGSISTLSIFVSLRLSEGWDEFFINLRHAYMLQHHGVYSINAQSLVEATVDLLPLVSTTVLSVLGMKPIDAFISLSLLGNAVVIIFSFLIVQKLTGDRTWALLAALALGLYPNVLWIGASGFSAVLFTGWILAASYFVLFTERRLVGLILLSTLTLVRTEGVLFAALLMSYVYVLKPLPEVWRTGDWKPVFRRGLVDGAIASAPFLLSLAARRVAFGHAIPNPISFKNTGFDRDYFGIGLDSFSEMATKHDLHLLVVIGMLLLMANFLAYRHRPLLNTWRIGVKQLLALNVVVFFFIHV
jgi:hypothetical protein